MTEHGNIVDETHATQPHAQGSEPPAGSAAEMAAILDRFMADLNAGDAPDRGRLLEAHPELAAQLDACLVGIEFIHRNRRKAFLGPASVAAATVLLIIGGFLSWSLYAKWRLGHIELTNDGSPLTVQVLSESGIEPIGEPIDLVTRSTLALPADDYRLRVNGIGRLGRTYRVAVNRGETQIYPLSLDEGRLLRVEGGPRMPFEKPPVEQPIPFAPLTVALELQPGKADLFEWARDSVIRRDALTGKVVWDALQAPKPLDQIRDPSDWLHEITGNPGEFVILEPALDLDADGTGDVVCFSHRIPVFIAFSGKDGSMLWSFRAELDDQRPSLDGPWFADQPIPGRRAGTLIGKPAFADLDRDGVLDLIATESFAETPQEIARRSMKKDTKNAHLNDLVLPRRMVVAVSGRSGRRLWSYPIDREFAVPPPQSPVHPATVLRGQRSTLVGIVIDTRWIGLDPGTGRPKGAAVELGFNVVREVQFADLDGDGEPEILAMGPGPTARQQVLAAFSYHTGRNLWIEPVNSPYNPASDLAPRPDWPLVGDFDGDGRSEIVVPDSGPMAPANGYRGVRMLDGASGKTRWVRPMRPETKADDRVEQLIPAPDLDGDGTRDLVACSRFDGRYPSTSFSTKSIEPERICVDALSGRDGHPLWWWQVELEIERSVGIGAPRWWGRGPDGWPLLAITLGGVHEIHNGMTANRPGIVHVLEASSGREVHSIEGMLSTAAADFDGDGLVDLWGEAGGQLSAFRGQSPEAWRALGYYGAAGKYSGPPHSMAQHAADFDGDGISDALITALRAPFGNQAAGSRTVVSRSGRDGHVLWKTSFEPRQRWGGDDRGDLYTEETFPLPTGDLDGDGISDVLVKRLVVNPQKNDRSATLPLDLVSGRTGRHLWSAAPLPLGSDSRGLSQVQSFDVRAIEPRSAPDVLVLHSTSFVKGAGAPQMFDPFESRMARLSGRDGRVVWDTLLAEEQHSHLGWKIPHPTFDDVDGDGSLDAVMVIPLTSHSTHRGFELRAISLREGKLIWSQSIQTSGSAKFPQFAVGDLDRDHRAEIVVTEELPRPGNKLEFNLRALDGRDGASLWSFSGGVDDASKCYKHGWISLADFDGDGLRRVCLGFSDPPGQERLILFDGHGREVARRELSPNAIFFSQSVADLNGDGRDELIISCGERLQILDGELKEIWSRQQSIHETWLNFLATPGATGTVIVYPNVGLDGADGHPRWAGQAALTLFGRSRTTLLDPGDSTRMPRLISTGDATVCRSALPTTPQGAHAPRQGVMVKPGIARNDPRWTRSLPWTWALVGTLDLKVFLFVAGLTLVNVGLPLVILSLAARRRPWSMRLLMALPVAAAVPLMALVNLEPVLESRADPLIASARLEFVLGTLAGVPIFAIAALACRNLVRRRWGALAGLAATTIVTSAVIGAAWLWFDIKSMPSIEHYGWPGWYLVVVPGSYAAGILVLVSGIMRRALKFVRVRS